MRKFFALLVLFLQFACGGLSLPQSTATQTAVRTITIVEDMEGFVISVPYPPYLYSIARFPEEREEFLLLNDINNEVFIGFSSNQTEGISHLDALDIYFSRMESGGWQIKRSEPSKIEIDDVEGLVFNLEMSKEGRDYEGQIFVVSPRSNFLFTGSGAAYISQDKHLWNNKGQATFNEIIQSIKFIGE